MASAFDAFCCQCGTWKQHGYICSLSQEAGYSSLRGFVANYLGVSVSKASKMDVRAGLASKMIDKLKEEIAKESNKTETSA